MKKRILSLFVIFFILTSCNGKEQSNEVIQENKTVEAQIENSERSSSVMVEAQNENLEPFWVEEIKKNISTRDVDYGSYNCFINLKDSNYFIRQDIDKIEFQEFINKQFDQNINIIYEQYLYYGDDIKLDENFGYLYFIYDNKKFFHIPSDLYPVLFMEGMQDSVPYTQEYLQNLTSNDWCFCFKNITVSSFLAENTKNGKWEYNGKDVERFPIVETKNSEYRYISMPWVEGVEGDGIGEWIEVEVASNPKYGTKYLMVLNGFVDVRRPHLYKENNRIKEATLICTPSIGNGDPFEIKINFEDFVYVKKIEFEKPCIKVKIRIDSVYEGEKYEDTCITSIFTPGTISEPL